MFIPHIKNLQSRVCQKTRFFKELRDHLDYHFYRSEWETCKKLGLYDDFLVRGI